MKEKYEKNKSTKNIITVLISSLFKLLLQQNQTIKQCLVVHAVS